MKPRKNIRLEHVLDGANAFACGVSGGPPYPPWNRTMPPRKNAGLCATCGCCARKAASVGIGREVVGLRQQRRVEPQHLSDRRRVLIEHFAQPLAGLLARSARR